jgi:protein-S-isoprenylcysteine O-methyltransferase Ste14
MDQRVWDRGEHVAKVRAIAASYVGVLAFSSVIFIAAGRITFRPGILYVVLALVGTTLNHLFMPADSALTATRIEETAAGESWDRRLLALYFVLSIVTFAVAGMDAGRFGWSGALPLWVTILGAVVLLAGQVLFALAKRENAFFSATVRIQSERDHAVCTTGPYRFVRHPGYLGMLMTSLAFPLVVGSYWAYVPTALGVAVLAVRTHLEDSLLARQLPGYSEYASTTKWRVVPGVF